jgi:L-asparaginase II
VGTEVTTAVIVVLALACVGLAVALVRMSGKLAEEKTTRVNAEANVEQLAAAVKLSDGIHADETKRLQAILARYKVNVDQLEEDIVKCADPEIRRQRVKELGQIVDIVPPKKKDKPS